MSNQSSPCGGSRAALPRFANNEPAVTILHLSDVQFGKHHRFADEGGGFGQRETRGLELLRRGCADVDPTYAR